jgi:hypothetical protein
VLLADVHSERVESLPQNVTVVFAWLFDWSSSLGPNMTACAPTGRLSSEKSLLGNHEPLR